jgi:FixJ family two-component response regulator
MQRKPLVAIVDDDESACEGTMDLLRAMGFVAKGIPTILVTAFPNDRDCARALKAGVVSYLVKPFKDADLLERIRSGLESHRVGNL